MVIKIIIIAAALLLPLLAIAYPYVWGIVLKAQMLKKLRQHARAKGFKYRRFYKNIFFVRNLSGRYDMVIYNDRKLYAVKLWSSYYTRSNLVLTKEGRIYELRESRPTFDTSEKGHSVKYIKGFTHSVPRTRLPKKYTKSQRQIENVLLIYPSYKGIFYIDGKKKIPLGTSDEIFDKRIYSPSAFTDELTLNGIDATNKDKKS